MATYIQKSSVLSNRKEATITNFEENQRGKTELFLDLFGF